MLKKYFLFKGMVGRPRLSGSSSHGARCGLPTIRKLRSFLVCVARGFAEDCLPAAALSRGESLLRSRTY